MKKNYLRFIFSLVVGTLLFYYTVKYFDIEKIVFLIRHARPDYLFFSIVLIILAYVVRGYRWMIWEKDLNFQDSFKLILIGFMGNNLLPARLGEILRAHCTAQKTKNGHGRTAALASITVERILDGLVISVIGIWGLIFVPVNKALFVSLMFVSMLFGLLTASLIAGIHFHKRIRRFLEKINKTFPGHLTKFGKEKINYFLDGLLLLENFALLFRAILFSACVWGIELIAYYLIANAVFNGVSLEICFLFLAVVNFASLFPFTVGGIGAIEGAATVSLIIAGIPATQSLAMVLIQHFYQFAFTTITGGIFYFTGKYYKTPIFKSTTPDKKVPSMLQKSGIEIFKDTREQLEELSANLGIETGGKREVVLSIIIPAYNEQKRLPKTVLETITWCNKNIKSYEIILVDDGSFDETPNIAKLFSDQVKVVCFIACPHFGKGATVRTGMLNACGKYVLFMDADGATPLSEIPKMMSKIDEGPDVVIGSRVVQQPGETEVVTSLHRRIVGRVFAAIVNIFVMPGFADTQCGFKIFKQETAKDVFFRQKINGFAFDVEILYIAKKLSLSISEVPVNWVNQEGSKVNLITDSMKMLCDILRIRWLHKGEQWKKKEHMIYVSQQMNTTIK
jgi:dolichyl-phosphate beta-glucosyltransferase